MRARVPHGYGPRELAAVAATASWAWFASGVRTFTRPAEILTFVPALAVLLLVLIRAGHRRGSVQQLAPVKHRSSWLPWIAALLALTAWELTELFSKPRSTHPTLSSLTNALLSTHPSRFAGFVLWLVLGGLLVQRGRSSV